MDERLGKFDTFIFDLDGTLLDTVQDLIDLTNRILAELDMPLRSREEIISFVGDGVRLFLSSALPDDASDDALDRALTLWERWESGYYECADPYDGIPEVLLELTRRGCKCAVFSNRDLDGVELLIERSGLVGFDLLQGTGDGIPRKPDPTGVRIAAEALGSDMARTIYIGDTPTDIIAGNEAGCTTAAVLWGYHSETALLAAGPDIVVTHPLELLQYAE